MCVRVRASVNGRTRVRAQDATGFIICHWYSNVLGGESPPSGAGEGVGERGVWDGDCWGGRAVLVITATRWKTYIRFGNLDIA